MMGRKWLNSCCWLLWMWVRLSESVPLSFTIDRGNKECLYDKLYEGEHVTMSVFITSGNALKGKAEIAGPVCADNVNTGSELWAQVELFDQGRRKEAPALQEKHMVDYEDLPHLIRYDDLGVGDDDGDDRFGDDDEIDTDDMYYYYDMEEENPEWMGHYDDDSISKEEREELMTQDKEIYTEKVEKWKKIREAKELKRNQKKAHLTLTAKRKKRAELMEMAEGGPFQRTYLIKKAGWYRLCLVADHYKITAEMEMRKQSELGHPNRNTGHLMTYERFEMLKEERKVTRQHRYELNKAVDGNLDPNSRKELVQPSDVEGLNGQLKKIHRLLQEVKEKQQREKHRLSVSAAVNEHTHAKMVMNSLFETLFYIAISAYQVYTIRRWFAGGPMLG
uniref:GOLD domain-containing protein n=1 Tax=Eucampia antarctica TaxID=49252 RepID=A0A7S2QZT2_9STRA|mmetsp:Transcript_10935/g.10450  ORF Transcript_10935/g.10450 Transcript_10935/m.10450 type:complete len:391 (+) Transcript_10935:107-1279(+)|eukprot:CAMPEP_0197826298 /NCGR_PEP_ID=MMETSP1437-20131217/3276_1 /TAXON_ID=49252 ORGANISM="Eucampia antarctica, Strain CCMP1452" /NCGR_SAMPLE_ID=MMETSP1437 /ASSEMBLY_ACC=CAM_ASM_001096 /LENGTH=390 /DNA_ID=CAMNT_0043426679 /DNA_START=107 /DNA_END=1279 /DNA_ORIENTATION=-